MYHQTNTKQMTAPTGDSVSHFRTVFPTSPPTSNPQLLGSTSSASPGSLDLPHLIHSASIISPIDKKKEDCPIHNTYYSHNIRHATYHLIHTYVYPVVRQSYHISSPIDKKEDCPIHNAYYSHTRHATLLNKAHQSWTTPIWKQSSHRPNNRRVSAN